MRSLAAKYEISLMHFFGRFFNFLPIQRTLYRKILKFSVKVYFTKV